MTIELLYYFPARATDVGVMPAFYEVIEPWQEKDAREIGGRDVSDDSRAWANYNHEFAEANEGYL